MSNEVFRSGLLEKRDSEWTDDRWLIPQRNEERVLKKKAFADAKRYKNLGHPSWLERIDAPAVTFQWVKVKREMQPKR